jgi:hypothetical protein
MSSIPQAVHSSANMQGTYTVRSSQVAAMGKKPSKSRCTQAHALLANQGKAREGYHHSNARWLNDAWFDQEDVA